MLKYNKAYHSHPLPDFPVDLPNLYKRSIIFFRALYSFVRLLPGHELHRRLSKYGQQLNGLSLGHRLSSNISIDQSEVSLGKYKEELVLFAMIRLTLYVY